MAGPKGPKAAALTAGGTSSVQQQLNTWAPGLMRSSDARAQPKQAPAKFPTRPAEAAISINRAIDFSIGTTGIHHTDRLGETCEGQASSRRMAMTATSTRSTRRAESNSLVARPPHAHPHPHRTTATATRLHHHNNQQNSGRPLKRLHDATNLRYDLKSPKKAKITVEIPSKSQYQARLFPGGVDSRAQHHRPPTHQPPTKPHDRQPATASAPAAPQPAAAPAPTATATAAAPQPDGPPAATTAEDQAAALTKHQEKVVNGIKHELDRLQPSSADMAASNKQGRKLRSQEGVRFKSELSAYFPEYDEVIGNIPKEDRMSSPPPSFSYQSDS